MLLPNEQWQIHAPSLHPASKTLYLHDHIPFTLQEKHTNTKKGNVIMDDDDDDDDGDNGCPALEATPSWSPNSCAAPRFFLTICGGPQDLHVG